MIIFKYLYICLPVNLHICLPVNLHICLPVNLHICLPVNLHICLPVNLGIPAAVASDCCVCEWEKCLGSLQHCTISLGVFGACSR